MKINRKITALILGALMLISPILYSCENDAQTENLVTLSFETNGGTELKDLSLKAGADIPANSINTTKEFYTFNRWENENGLPVSLNVMPQEDTKVFASWTPISVYAVNFHTNGADEIDRQVNAVGEKVTKPIDPVKQNYVFGGWYLDSGFDNDSLFDFSSTPIGNLNLYAKWIVAQNSASVKVFLNNVLINEYAVVKNSYITEPVVPDEANDIFYTSWYNIPNITSISAQRISFPHQITGNISLYASYSTLGLSNTGNDNAYVDSYSGSSSTVVIKYGTTQIRANAFRGNNTITKVIIPDTVTQIFDSAFAECTRLNSVVMPSNITKIDNNAFLGCLALESITLPKTLTEIGNNSFYDTAIRTVDLSDFNALVKIGDGAFGNCSNLREVRFPLNSTAFTDIGNNAFYNCQSISEISIPKSVLRIGGGAFSKCAGIRTFTVHAENPNYSVASDGHLYSKDMKTLMLYIQREGETEFRIDESSDIESIESNALYGASINKVVIEKAGISFGKGAFERCDSITEMRLEDLGTQNVKNIAYLFGASSAQLNIEGNRYTPLGLKTIVLGNVEELPDYAFFGCNALETISTGASGGFTKIGKLAFAYTSLKSFDIGKNLTDFGENVFEGCDLLTEITVNAQNPSFEKNSTYNCLYYIKEAQKTLIKVFDAPETVVVDDDTTSIDSFALNGCLNIKSLTLPFIGKSKTADKSSNYFSYIFGCSLTSLSGSFTPVLDKLTISNPLTKIPDEAFYNCQIKLFDLTASSATLKEYGLASFYGNSIMEGFSNGSGGTVSVYNPGTASFIIGDYAFGECYLEGETIQFADAVSYPNALEIGDNVTYLGEGAFGVNNFKNISIKANITKIKPYTFYRNFGITGAKNSYVDESGNTVSAYKTRIEIPASVEIIDERAFNAYDDTDYARKVSLNGNLTVDIPENSDLISFSETLTAGALSRAFMLSGVRTIRIPSKVENIGWGAFNYCPLEFFEIANDSKLVYLGAAFVNCTPFVEEINLPYTLRQISGSFNISKISGEAECKLKKVTIGDSQNGSSLLWILVDSFNAYSLESLVLHKKVGSISENDQERIDKLTEALEDKRTQYYDMYEYADESVLSAMLDEMDRMEKEIEEIARFSSMTKINYYYHYLYGEVWAFDTASENLRIYVPSDLVSVYKSDSMWGRYSDKIIRITA